MGRRLLRGGREEGFTLVELVAVLLIIGILSAIAIPFVGRTRTKRIRVDGTNALMILRGFQDHWFERTGAFLYSPAAAADRLIQWNTVTTRECASAVLNSTFQQTIHQQVFTPAGYCTWEYFVIDDRCADDCPDAGQGIADTGVEYCVIAQSRQTWSGGNQQLPTAGERFCVDKVGRQFSNIAGGYPSWP